MDQPDPNMFAEFSSRGGQSQNITIPPGGVRQVAVKFKASRAAYPRPGQCVAAGMDVSSQPEV
jgi:hypothetical protein